MRLLSNGGQAAAAQGSVVDTLEIRLRELILGWEKRAYSLDNCQCWHECSCYWKATELEDCIKEAKALIVA